MCGGEPAPEERGDSCGQPALFGRGQVRWTHPNRCRLLLPLGSGSAVLPCGHGAGEQLGNPWESSFLYLAPFCIRENRAPVASPTHAIAPPCDCAFLRAQKGASLRNRPLPACSSLTPSRLGSGVSKGISVALLREAAPGKGFSLLPSPLAVPGSAMSRPAPQ